MDVKLKRSRRATVRNDRGEGPVSYMAVILLIALIAGAIVKTGVADDIANGIKKAAHQVWVKGGGGEEPKEDPKKDPKK